MFFDYPGFSMRKIEGLYIEALGSALEITMGLFRILVAIGSILLAFHGFLFFGPILGGPLVAAGIYLLYQEFTERGKKGRLHPQESRPLHLHRIARLAVNQ